MEQFKKIILMIVALLWMAHPCFATPVADNKAQKKITTTVKKSNNKQTSKKKKAIVKKNKKIPHNRPHRVSSPIVNERLAVVQPTTMVSRSRRFVASIEERLVDFVHKTVSTLRYSVYKLGGRRFDTSSGIYILDCSSYVDRILEAIYPQAYSSLVNWTGSDKPTSYDYYSFFTNLPSKSQRYWAPVDDVEKLKPGDILVFRYKNSKGDEVGGHVMIVMDKPIPDEDAFHVRVADSASAGHSKDTRVSNVSGIGIGTMLLKVNPKTYQPSAYAWRIGSRWKNNAYFAMARPIGDRNTSA